MNKIIALCVAAGASATIPALYQSDPEFYDALLRRTVAPEQTQTGTPSSVSVNRVDIAPAAPLSGRARLEADATGHFTGDFKLNGRIQKAMVDTGATVVAINRSAARRIGIRLSQSDFRHRVKTANGDTAAAAVTIAEMSIGRIRVRDVQAVVLEDTALDTALIGMSFLNRLSSFKVEGGTLVLEQ